MKDDTVERYQTIARNTGMFRAEEIEVLREVLNEWKYNTQTTYCLLEENDEDVIRGFIIFGKIPMTESGWDIYWLVVDKPFQGKGIGTSLLKHAQDLIMQKNRNAILRVETSGKDAYAQVRRFYQRAGFAESGRIPDLYQQGDDLVILHKAL